jgi:methionine aminopeptidase
VADKTLLDTDIFSELRILRRGQAKHQRVAIEIHDAGSIARMRVAGHAAAATLALVGTRIRAGVSTAEIESWVRTIEPMINLGSREVRMLDDGWTVLTADGRLSAQFEHTVIVTRDGCEVTTASSLLIPILAERRGRS